MKTNAHLVRMSAAILAMALAATSIAQTGPPGGGPGGGPPQGGPPRGGPGGMMFMRRHMTLADVPLEMMKAELNLTADQTTKIESILDEARAERRKMMPQGGPGGPPLGGGQGGPPPIGGDGSLPPERHGDGDGPPPLGQGGPPPPQGAFSGPGGPGGPRNDRMAELDKATAAKIVAELDDQQKAKAPKVVANADGLQSAGIPLVAYGKLKLTSDQEASIVKIGQDLKAKQDDAMKQQQGGDPRQMFDAMRTAHDEANSAIKSILNADQNATLDAMRSRRPPFGGPPPGGPGGPPPGGGGGGGGGR